MGYFNRVILDGISIKDQNNKDLLRAARLSAKIDLIPLLHGKISISNIQFYGFDIHLYQRRAEEKPNFQFLIDAFSKPKKDSISTLPDLRINSILVRRGKLSWHRYHKPPTPHRFNPGHIVLDKISATVSLKCLTKDSLNLNVKKIAFEEQSGIRLKQLSFKVKANQQEAQVEDFSIELSQSRLAIPSVTFSYQHSQDKYGKAHDHGLQCQDGTAEGVLFPSDFIPLYPQLAKVKPLNALFPLQFATRFKGDLRQITAEQFTLYNEERSIVLDAPLTATSLKDKELRTFHAEIRDLRITPEAFRQIASWQENLNGHARLALSSIGPLNANGELSYSQQAIQSHLNLHTALGSLTVSGKLADRNKLEAYVRTTGFHVGKLVGKEEQLGKIAFDLSGNGLLQQGKYPALSFRGKASTLEFRHYDYHDLELQADYKNGGFNAAVSIDDPNVSLSAQGQFNLKSPTPYIKAEAAIRHFAPHALALTPKYEGMAFQGDLLADLQGRSIDGVEGKVSLDNFRMTTPEEEYTTGPVWFEAAKREGRRSLLLHSDFLHAEMEGDFRFATLIAHSRELLHAYLPSFVKAPQRKNDMPDEVALFMHIDNTELVEKIFGIPLRIPKPGYVNGYFNSQTKELDLNASIPSFNYNGQQLDDIRLLAGCLKDSVKCVVDFKKQIGKAPVDFRLLARAANDNVHTGLDWQNHTDKVYRGALSADTRFTRNEEGKMLTDITIHPSQIVVNDSAWNVHASTVHVAPGMANIDGFAIEQGDRHLILNGNVSGNSTDSLTADLKDINLEYIFNIVNFHAVDFAGRATGRVYAANLMKSPDVDARIHVQDFKFNRAYLGEMNLIGGWEKEENAITLQARMSDPAHRSETTVDGNIRIGAAPRGGLDLMIRTENIDLSFLNQYTNGIFDGLYGRASGWTRVFGPFKGINLEGDMLVSEGGMKVSSTEVDYRLVNDSVFLRPDNIYFRNVLVYDRQGAPGKGSHYAIVNGALRHEHLSNMTFDFDIDARNILGYDVREFGDEVFCGTAYATGRISFEGKPGDINIDINARPEAGTVFTYNLASPTTLGDGLFITYKTPEDSTERQNPESRPALPQETESDMHINFRLGLTPDATMKILMDPKAGDYIALNGSGNIRATYYNKGDFTMYGTYTIARGIYKLSLQDVIRKDFIFNPGGTIVFGGSPIEADLDLQAVYTVPSVSLNDLSARSTFSQNNVRVNCLMNLTGKAQSPQISFDFELPTVNEDEQQMVRSLISTEEEKNMQVIYLLGIGRFYTYDYNNTEQSQSSVAMKSLLSSTLSGQLNQMFSTLLGNNSNWNIGTNLSTGEMGWSDMDVEGLLSGRLLNNRLLINGNFGYRDNSTNPNGNFIGDFDLQWLLTRNGNVSLKAYSKTNDRYFTKSSLTTQGIGIGLKHDFNSWRDILRLFVPKKRRKAANP